MITKNRIRKDFTEDATALNSYRKAIVALQNKDFSNCSDELTYLIDECKYGNSADVRWLKAQYYFELGELLGGKVINECRSCLDIEASELMEAFLWKAPESVNENKVKEELADIVNYTLLIADKYQLNIADIVRKKMKVNASKYPVAKARGSAKKYTEI